MPSPTIRSEVIRVLVQQAERNCVYARNCAAGAALSERAGFEAEAAAYAEVATALRKLLDAPAPEAR